jgi:hypothetical protein
MKSMITTPEQILEAWENAYIRLNAEGRREFKSHRITKKLCQQRLVDIKAAIYQGKKQYLPDVLEYLQAIETANKAQSKEVIREVVYVDSHTWAGSYSSDLKKTSSYDCSVCESPVIGLRCKCAVAA